MFAQNHAVASASDGVVGNRSGTGVLFEKVRVAGLELDNRVVMAPMTRYFCYGGVPDEKVARYYARRAQCGVGLVIAESAYVDLPSAGNRPNAACFTERAAGGWELVVGAVHAAGGKIFSQLLHSGGRRGRENPEDEPHLNLSPSGIGLDGTAHGTALNDAQICQVVQAFADAAALAERLGFDGVEVHGAHGYLLDQFHWPVTNRRTDRYNGSMVDRTRMSAEVVQAIRSRVSRTFPVSFRFSQWKLYNYEARSLENAHELELFTETLGRAGVDIFHVSTRRFWLPAFDESELSLAAWTRKISGMPVIAAGSLGIDEQFLETEAGREYAVNVDVQRAADAVARGDFDLIAIGRALIANPDWVSRARAANKSGLRPYSHALDPTLD
jgi:2,4-dienoyl-CoA reductase-like NADH-dependent reductase (Old Yellow Enzyme family)